MGDDADYAVRSGVTDLVLALVLEEHGPGAIVERPINPQLSIPEWGPADYLVGLRTANRVAGDLSEIIPARAPRLVEFSDSRLSWELRQLIHRYAVKARGEGRSWRELAEPLGVDANDSAAAFELLAGPRSLHHPPCLVWTCLSCKEMVTDRGPYNGHPDDDESGHADGCQRHADEVTAYRQSLNGPDELTRRRIAKGAR